MKRKTPFFLETNQSIGSTKIDREITAIPFAETLFGNFPIELRDQIFSEVFFKTPPLVKIECRATQEQKNAVIIGNAYHVIRNVDNQQNYTYSIGFAKKSNRSEFTYETALLDKNSVFYHMITETPERLTSMASGSAPHDTCAFYFLEEAIREKGGFVDFLQNRIHLPEACKDWNEYFKSNKTLRKEQVKLAMQHLLFGNQAMVEKLVRADPSFLLEKNTLPVKDISGKPVVGKTLLQAALCARDIANNLTETIIGPQGEIIINDLNKTIMMTEMLKKYFFRLDNGWEEMQAQAHELFPNRFPEHDTAQKTKASIFRQGTLKPLMETIKAATDEEIEEMLRNKKADSPLGKAFGSFRKEIQRLSFEDNLFNPYYLLGALGVFTKEGRDNRRIEQEEHQLDEHQPYGKKIRSNASCLFCIQGIGFIQRFLPASYLQAFLQNLYSSTQDNKKRLRREFKLHTNGMNTYPVDFISSLPGLGFNYWLSGYSQNFQGQPIDIDMNHVIFLTSNFNEFCTKEANALSNLCEELRAQSRRPGNV